MKRTMQRRIIYYKSYDDDFIESKNQNYKISEDYVWTHTNLFYRFFAWLLYKVMIVIDFFYCKFILGIKVENGRILKKYRRSGCFLFGNHTQPIGDAFIPTYVSGGKRVNVIVSPANLGIPFLGKFLPMLGALPIPKSIKGLAKFKEAVEVSVSLGRCVVIYPEAHVWEYYTKIRPFSANSFRFPIENDVPVFCMTTTYKKSKKRDKPDIVVYVDGPFMADKDCSLKEQRQRLRDEVYECMVKRSKNSTYEYIHYEEDKTV